MLILTILTENFRDTFASTEVFIFAQVTAILVLYIIVYVGIQSTRVHDDGWSGKKTL